MSHGCCRGKSSLWAIIEGWLYQVVLPLLYVIGYIGLRYTTQQYHLWPYHKAVFAPEMGIVEKRFGCLLSRRQAKLFDGAPAQQYGKRRHTYRYTGRTDNDVFLRQHASTICVIEACVTEHLLTRIFYVCFGKHAFTIHLIFQYACYRGIVRKKGCH